MEKKVNLICGHFEGVDQRVLDNREIDELSIGDFVLSGGETASYVFLDTILRLLPGVLGNKLPSLISYCCWALVSRIFVCASRKPIV